MSTTPFWFGPEDRRLFGWLHEPVGPPRGGVVLCYPVGYEHLLAYSTFARLAERLASAGFLVLRFDYDGTGDSAGNDYEPARVRAWLESIRRAIELVHGMTGQNVSLVGMRLGGTLAAMVAGETSDVAGVVLWDPCVSGRSFIRESKMLHIVGVGVDDHPIDDGAVEVAGHVFTKETVAELAAADLASIEAPLAPRVLALVRSDRTFNSKVKAHLDATSDVTWDDAVGQGDLIDELALIERVPLQAIDRIVDWMQAAFPSDGSAPMARPELPNTAVMRHGDDVDVVDVVERPVRLGALGLFGIITEPLPGDGDTPIVICLNYGTAHHIGPSRLWVELAREWAAHGVRVLRLDLSGVGDSPVRSGQRSGLSNAPEAFDDMVQVLTDLNSADPHDAVVVGVCSGAYLSIDVAALHGVRGIYALNANLRFEPDDLLAGAGDANRALPPSRSFIRRVSASGLGDRLKDRLPPLLWHVLDRLHIHPAPTHALERIVDKGVDTFIGYGTDNLLTMLTQRSKYALRRLEERPNFHLEVVDGMDHLLMLRRHRQRMADALTAHIVPKYASAGPAAQRSPVSTSES